MIDSLRANLSRARAPDTTLQACGQDDALLRDARGFGVVTLHRPSNVDEPETLEHLLRTLSEVARRLPLVFVMHPRTRERVERFGLMPLVAASRIALLPPQGYLETLGLLSKATLVLTDSGGLQEETTALGVVCLTLRENTERPITVEQGTNTVVGRDRGAILGAVDDVLAGGGKRGRVPELWDGRAAERIAADLAQYLLLRDNSEARIG
jgi:UDP-N-acetylglucosamine 2-epimerase (non-hydrolysing)